MTVIAWDGATLAADKRMSMGCHFNTVTKVFAAGEYLIGFTGSAKYMGAFLAWVESGASADAYPKCSDDDGGIHALAVRRDGSVWKFEGTAYPVRIEDQHAAAGTGRDYARAAMHLGKSAREAVEIACLFDENCGNGVDTLAFASSPLPLQERHL
ncbi:MAG: hypothetical protein JWM41_2892 [Gemmatimonadetes bacterium]|nr:hypothetical protein [Gemmatimonadota bacterium]